MKNRIKHKLFRSSALLMVAVIFFQLALFTAYEAREYYLETHGFVEEVEQEDLNQTFTEELVSGDWQELLVLLVIGMITMPIILLYLRFFLKRTLSPLEQIAEEALAISEGRLDKRLSAYAYDDEIGVLITSLNKAFDQHQASMERQARFSSNASHELRTPLTVIQADTEVTLSRRRTPEEYEKCLHSIAEETHHLINILEQLLVLSGMEHSAYVKGKEPVDLEELCHEVTTAYEAMAQEKNISVHLNLQPVKINGHRQLLVLALSNLLSNAIQVCGVGGEVEIALHPTPKGWLSWTVTDTGPPISREELAGLFERFNRRPNTPWKGSGLGLSIVADAVALHDGIVRAERIDENHTQFIIELPQDTAYTALR